MKPTAQHIEDYCAIDFGTSNSALAVCIDGMPTLVPLEGDNFNLPTALFYPSEPDEDIQIGRAAVASYMAADEGRLLRSLKSVLGSSLMDSQTELGPGRVMSFNDILADFLSRIKFRAEKATGAKLRRALLGRPAFFVDDDAERDQKAQQALEAAAKTAGFEEVAFEYEPVAAALAFAHNSDGMHLALVADIGGGTSDFSIIQMTAEGSRILANHGVHVAGTDFDRRVSLTRVMPLLGLGATNANGRAVPASIYRDLATWHLVNGLYSQKSKASLHSHRDMYGSKQFYQRLARVLEDRLGHQLLAQAEQAKIQASEAGEFLMLLDEVERGLQCQVTRRHVDEAIHNEMGQIADAALVTIGQAGLKPEDITALFFTGGSSGLRLLRNRVASVVPNAKAIEGERFDSVAFGLGIAAVMRWDV